MNTPKQRGEAKFARLPIKIIPTTAETRKRLPSWIRVKAPVNPAVNALKALLRTHQLVSVCEEAACPNLSECFSHGTATFMIMGDKCTRRCTFCDVAHGRPDPLDPEEPLRLAKALSQMQLQYIVITSVDRDDLRDGGASHFAACIQAVRAHCPKTKIEILVPDFRGRMEKALQNLQVALPDVFNHNLETVPRLYKAVRPGSDYVASLTLIQSFKKQFPDVPTKSGIMLGLGETDDEVLATLEDLRKYDCDMLTLGQYLQPSLHHFPVDRYLTPKQFDAFAVQARKMGFTNVASGPLVRSSYHADQQAAGKNVS